MSQPNQILAFRNGSFMKVTDLQAYKIEDYQRRLIWGGFGKSGRMRTATRVYSDRDVALYKEDL